MATSTDLNEERAVEVFGAQAFLYLPTSQRQVLSLARVPTICEPTNQLTSFNLLQQTLGRRIASGSGSNSLQSAWLCFVNTPQQVSHLHLVSSASSQAGQLRKVDCSRTRLDLSKSSFKFDATPSGILRSIKPSTRSPSRPAFKFKSPPKHDLSLCRSELSCFQQSQFYADFITITTVLMNSCSPRLTACPTAAGYEES